MIALGKHARQPRSSAATDQPLPADSILYAGIPMRRTTVKLSDDLDAKLRHEAARRGLTVSELTREAIETHLSPTPGRRRLLAAGAGRSGARDISVRIEEIIEQELAR